MRRAPSGVPRGQGPPPPSGFPPDALKTVVGQPSTQGVVHAAAVRRSTLSEVRALLASVGLRPTAIVGGGTFDGFPAPPRLCGRWAPPPVGRRRAVVGAGGIAFAAIALMVMALRPDATPVVPAALPAPAIVAVAPEAAAPALLPPAVETAAAPVVAPVRVAWVGRPKPRPAALSLPAEVTGQPIATLGTRSVDLVFVEKQDRPVAELRLAQISNPRGPLTDVAVPLHRPETRTAKATTLDAAALGVVPDILRPAHRPGAVPAKAASSAKAAAPVPAAATSASLAGPRPMARPGATPEARQAARPAAEPVRVASLGNQINDAVIAAAVLSPVARPASFQTATPAPAPKAAAKPATVAVRPVAAKPKVVAPAPKVAAAPVAVPVVKPVAKPAPQRVVTVAPKPTAQRVATAEPVRVVQQSPLRVVRVEEKRPASTTQSRVTIAPPPKAAAPVRVAAAAPAPTPTVRRQSTSAGFFGNRSARKNLTLVGIFGGSDGRHALIQMPNGKIQKVAAGDRVQGVQIAAIETNSVRISDGRRESLLLMPD